MSTFDPRRATRSIHRVAYQHPRLRDWMQGHGVEVLKFFDNLLIQKFGVYPNKVEEAIAKSGPGNWTLLLELHTKDRQKQASLASQLDRWAPDAQTASRLLDAVDEAGAMYAEVGERGRTDIGMIAKGWGLRPSTAPSESFGADDPSGQWIKFPGWNEKNTSISSDGYAVDGSRVKIFSTKKDAQTAAKTIGFRNSDVCAVTSRFTYGWAICDGRFGMISKIWWEAHLKAKKGAEMEGLRPVEIGAVETLLSAGYEPRPGVIHMGSSGNFSKAQRFMKKGSRPVGVSRMLERQRPQQDGTLNLIGFNDQGYDVIDVRLTSAKIEL